MGDWGDLHEDLLCVIVEKLKLMEDWLSFGMVCKSWKEAAASRRRHYYQLPWLILAEEEAESRDDRRRPCRGIYSISQEEIICKNLYLPPEMADRRCVGLNYGWILTISRTGDMNLVNPLSNRKNVIGLPSQTSILDFITHNPFPSHIFTKTGALSGNPSLGDDYALVIVHIVGDHMSYWRPGDKCWGAIKISNLVVDVTYFNDQFYAVTYGGCVWAWTRDIHQQQPQPVLLAKIYRPGYEPDQSYIVGSAGGGGGGVKLLVVARWELILPLEDDYLLVDRAVLEQENGYHLRDEDFRLVEDREYGVERFKVYQVDVTNGKSEKIQDLGDRAVFVGDNTSMLYDHISKSYPELIKPNYIYYTDDVYEAYYILIKGGGKSMGCYSLEHARVNKFNASPSFSRVSPPFWFKPFL